MRSIFVAALIAALCALPASIAGAAEDPGSEKLTACTATEGHDALEALKGAPPSGQITSALPRTGFIPSGNDMVVVLDGVPTTDKYRALVKRGGGEASDDAHPTLRLGPSINAQKIGADDPLVTAHRVSANAMVVTLRVPSVPWWFWRESTIYLFGCVNKDAPQPSFVAVFTAPMSGRGWCMVFTLLSVVVAYLAMVTAVYRTEKKQKQAALAGKVRWCQYLDPVDLTAGVDGQGSLSKLQILFFSLIVFGMLSYIVMRTGVLSDLSSTILLLLGISGVGAAAAKGTEVGRNRLDFENWAWLIRKGWLPQGGQATVTRAQWRDLVTTDGEFDVYHFQMLVFSLVVGGALLTTGLNDLASFSVPTTLLGVLGLSQVVYVGGKLVAPPSYANLDDSVGKLRTLEAAFVKAATISPDPIAAAAQPQLPPADLDEAKRRAANGAAPEDKVSYSKFKEAAQNTRIMFKSLFAREVTDAQIEPAFV